eukprot:Gregarina_sp_Poly_1__3121@NODE_187_length_11680_cov_128_523810_g166_i0_p1_GENE_NODE_187_length_11680_cov_128_523810_g166_i0NODE_187_length_11680_cov_128_523810_g166_i0_p1_ORF_typecomplete_len1811_score286_02RNA_pol_Rpb1_5/PF04998_17/7_8e02RNA_pol_Rpb1_5/PF04998_17/9_2e116RNA_pol_Rpb1_1/PF04997_12/1_5e85RNA_pol_Rpb1_2/PF00623_20/2_5e70RNA_pol_Rpb1_6/PF04992_14/1_2e54RNA_pol_Rpb1_3/PF04983_18/1_1e38RNA_pol_Rpb1_7/PF04990_12/1e37RNA_pol_Rpb1_4/PF05000_17/1_8e35_NODE_187_length_11680_cov_128_523810_
MTTLIDLNQPYSPCDIKKVRALEFGVFDPDHIRRFSVCEVDSAELYENGVPKTGGLNDPLMGTTDYRINCKSCSMDFKLCPGHFGHINLVKPVYNVGFVGAILNILRCVCYSCSRLLVDYNDPKFIAASRTKNPKARLTKILACCRAKKTCEPSTADGSDDLRSGGCGSVQPKYRRENINIVVDFSGNEKDQVRDEREDEMDQDNNGDTKRIFTAEEALNVLKRISPEEMKLLGFDIEHSRPHWMIIQALLVVPPCVRPYVQFGHDRSEDDLTLKLLDIVKINRQLRKYEEQGVAAHVVQEAVALLQYHIATFINNEIPGLPVATTKSKKPIKSLRERLKGKEGRLRGNLMGKRVDFSARTVITGDPNLGIDQVGVPRSIAMNLTYPEIVTPMNIELLRQAVSNGPSIHPGARYITRTDGTRFDLRHCQGNPAVLQLEAGYKVERHMRDGDFVLFNRQPSLHKMSIMGHKAKVLPWSTFRCNLSVTSPYNADFDGDEMNLHLAQSMETRAEIKHLCLVPRQIVSPQGNKPVMGIVQDSLLGLAKVTSRNTFVTKDLMMVLCMWVPYWNGHLPPPTIWRPQELWTGKQLMTLLLALDGDPSRAVGTGNINLVRDGAIKLKSDHPHMSENDGRVVIRNSEHLAGVICKRTAGTSSGSLIHVLWHDAGPDKTKEFLSSTQKVINNWLVTQGFTVGVCDIIADDGTMSRVKDALDQSNNRVNELIGLARRGKLETQPGKSLLESFENRVNQELNQAREASGKIASENLTDKNNIIAMVNAGSKGSTINISQIMACVGQQNVEGKRIPFGFKDRSLPHFVKHDYGPQSRGFVINSYLTGLTPHELFFHAMGGREGIIDTACKTSETGYIQRRLVKAMEDVLVGYDRTVRNSLGEIVQFLYGEDGMAGEFVEDQVMDLLKLDNEKTERRYRHDFRNPRYGEGWILNEDLREDLKFSFEKQSILNAEWEEIVASKRKMCLEIFSDGEAKQHIPVNIPRLIQFAKSKFGNEDTSSVSPIDVIQRVDDLVNNNLILLSHEGGSDDPLMVEVQKNATSLFAIHCRTHLNSRKILEQDKLGPQALEWVFGEIIHQFQKALAHPGEVVGAMAAQSIGEPATQMTLNTFHFAGVGSKNVTLGVPRLRELINVAKTVKTPSLTVYLQDSASRDSELAKSVQSQLEHTTLDKVAAFVQLAYDPDPMNTVIPTDRVWVSEYYEFPGEDDLNLNRLGRWVLRIQLIDKLITDKLLTMKEIGQRVLAEFSSDEIDVIWTDDNSEELVLRIRVKHSAHWEEKGAQEVDEYGNPVSAAGNDEDESRFLQKLMAQCLASLTLRGIQGIVKVYMREEKTPVYDAQVGKFTIKGGRWVLDTDGCNLEEVLPVTSVDATRTTSNSIVEVFAVLGIEAVRKMLLRELRAVISFDGSYVNYRHLAILCDVMTQRGHLMPITRNGINRVERGCLAKCSFEETVEILMQAACFGETDHLKGITENIMLGQLAQFGTGICDIIIDDAKLKDPSTHFETGSVTGGLGDNLGFDSPVDSPTTSAGGSSPQQSFKDFVTSPFSPFSPSLSAGQILSPTVSGSGMFSNQFSPIAASPRSATAMSPTNSAGGHISPIMGVFSPTQQAFSPTSPSITSPLNSPSCLSPTSPLFMEAYTPSSPNRLQSPIYSVTSPNAQQYSPTSYPNITSPAYSPSSPPYSPSAAPTSPDYSPTNPTSPIYSVMSPVYSPPMSPTNYSPTSPRPMSPMISPTSPNFSRAVSPPTYAPSSPQFGMSALNPQSPGAYSPVAQAYSPTGVVMSPSANPQVPMSPGYIQSPRYDPLMSP